MSNDALVIRCSSTTTFPGCARRWAAHNLSREIRNAGYALRQSTQGGMIREVPRLRIEWDAEPAHNE